MAKDFMYQSKLVELTAASTELSGNFNDLFLDIVDHKFIIVVAPSAAERDKVKINVQVGNYLLSAGAVGTVTSASTTDLNTNATVYYSKFDLTGVPVSQIFWGCTALTTGQKATIQFLGGTY